MELLSQGANDPVLLAILEYAYDPFKHYYINKIKVPKVSGHETLANSLPYWTAMLDDMATRKISGKMAKSLLDTVLINLMSPDQEILIQIFKKDLRAGISTKTINMGIPGLIEDFGVNLACSYDDKGWTGEELGSLKIDGLRTRYQDKDFFTRNGHKILGLDHLKEQIDPAIPKLDGELQLPGIDFDSSSGKIRSHASEEEVKLHIIDLPVFGIPKLERYQQSLYYGDMCGPQVTVLKNILIRNEVMCDRNFDKALAGGYEGLVLVKPNSFYEEKRSKFWRKRKDSDTHDLPIVSFEPGKEGKQYEYTLGAMIVELPSGVLVRVGQGHKGSLPNSKRDEIWANRDRWIGRTIEVLFHQPTAKGSLRHPRYVRTRDDK